MPKSLGEINTKDINYYSGQDRDPKTGLPKGLKSQPSSNKDTGVMDESLLGKIRQTLTGASSEINESVSEDIVQHDKLVKAIRNSETDKLTKAKLLSTAAKVRGLKSEDIVNERLGGKGYSKKATGGGGDWPDSDRGAGNKATRRAGGKVKLKSPTYIAHVVNKGKKDIDAKKNPVVKAGKKRRNVKTGRLEIPKESMQHRRNPEGSIKDRFKSRQTDPSKDNFTGIGDDIGEIMRQNAAMKKAAAKKTKKEELELEARVEQGRSDYGKASVRNKRAFGIEGEPEATSGSKERGKMIDARRYRHRTKRGIKKGDYKIDESHATARTVGEKRKKQKLAILLSKIDDKKKKKGSVKESKSYKDYMDDVRKSKERKKSVRDARKVKNDAFVDRVKYGIRFYDKEGSGRIVKGKKVYSSASEGVVQVAKAAMNVAKKVLATQGGGKFAKNTKTGSQTVSPKKKEDPNKEDQPNPGITSTTNAKKKSGVVGIATHVDGKKIAKGAKNAVKGYTAMFDAPSSESEV